MTDRMNAIKNKYGAMESNYIGAIRGKRKKEEEEEDKGYKAWKKKVDDELKKEENANAKRAKEQAFSDKFNTAKNLAEMYPVGNKSKSKSNQSIMFNDWDKASNTNSFLRNAEQKYEDKTLIFKAEKAKKQKLTKEQKEYILNKDYKVRKELENEYDDTLNTRKKYNDIYTSNIVNGKKIDESDLFYKNITGLDIEKSPALMKARMGLTKFSQSGAASMVGDEAIKDKRLDGKNKIANAAIEMGGMVAGMAFNPASGGGIGALGSGVEKGAAYLGNRFLPKLANKIPNAVAKIGKGALTGAVDMGTYSTVQQEGRKLNGEKITATEELKNIGREAAFGGAFGGTLSALGITSKGITGKIFNRSKAGDAIIKPIEAEEKLIPSQITKPKSGMSKSKYKSALDYHNAMHDEYKNAENAWEDAVYNIQNRFGQKELTVPEQNLIKSEMGIDIESLANNYDRAYNNFNQAKEALNKSIERNAAKTSNITNNHGLGQDISSDINIQQPNSSNIGNVGHDNNILDMPIVNRKFKTQDISTDTQFMTDTSNNGTFKDKIIKAKDTIARLFSDRYSDVNKVSKEANELLNLESQSSGTVDYILNNKLVNKNGDPLTNKSFKDVLTMSDKKLQKQYEDYLLNKHNIDRYREGKTLLANTEGANITPEQSQQIISKYEQVYPEFKELSNQYSTNWNTFSNEWLSDFVNKDTLKMLQEKYPSYVPSYRQQESFSTQLPTNRIVSGAKIKEATGSTKKIIPLNEQISEQVNKIVKANRRNEAYKEMLKPVLENPEKYSNKIEIVKIGTDKYANTAEREIAQQVLSMQDDVIAGEDSINSLVDIINNPVKQVQGRDGYLTIFDKGTPITVKIKDQNLFNALNKSQKTDNLSFVGKAWNKYVLTPFKGAITQYNPFFAVRNISRDLPTAYIQGSENNIAKFAGQRAKSVYDIVKKDPLWEKYKALGGEMSNISSNPLGQAGIKDSKVGKVLSFVPHKYSDFLGVSEQFNRFAEFKKVLNETNDVNKARIAAANITVNFGKGGELIKAIDKVIPYSNAAVQGIIKTAETFKDKPLQSIGKSVLSTTIPAAGFYYYNNSNPERQKIYDEITTDVKNTNYVVVVNKDTIIKIPKTQQAGLIFGSLGERLYDYFAKNDKEAFKGMPETLKKSFLPIDYKSGVVMPAINVAMGGNKDFFGRDIVPQSLQNMSPEQQYDEKTTTLSKFMGDKFGLSPKKVDYLLDSYAGVIYDIMKKSGQDNKGNFIKGLADTGKANFTINTDYGKTTSNYYDLVNKYRTEKADFNKSIVKKKEKALKDTGSKTLQSSDAKSYLNSLLSNKEYDKSQKLNELNKIINEQSEELQGLSTKDKKNKIKEFFKALEEYKK